VGVSIMSTWSNKDQATPAPALYPENIKGTGYF